MIALRESIVHKKLSSLPSTSKLRMESSGMTTGRTFRLCGATGVITKLALFGNKIGPPHESEYPVEPVGLETINPSAQYEFIKSPLINVWMVIMDKVVSFETVKSFNAMGMPPKVLTHFPIVTVFFF